MKNTFYAVVAATLAMFATSGIVALATAASPDATIAEHELARVHAELVDHLDSKIMAQLSELRGSLPIASVE
jgi:hypothetical protein